MCSMFPAPLVASVVHQDASGGGETYRECNCPNRDCSVQFCMFHPLEAYVVHVGNRRTWPSFTQLATGVTSSSPSSSQGATRLCAVLSRDGHASCYGGSCCPPSSVGRPNYGQQTASDKTTSGSVMSNTAGYPPIHPFPLPHPYPLLIHILLLLSKLVPAPLCASRFPYYRLHLLPHHLHPHQPDDGRGGKSRVRFYPSLALCVGYRRSLAASASRNGQGDKKPFALVR